MAEGDREVTGAEIKTGSSGEVTGIQINPGRAGEHGRITAWSSPDGDLSARLLWPPSRAEFDAVVARLEALERVVLRRMPDAIERQREREARSEGE